VPASQVQSPSSNPSTAKKKKERKRKVSGNFSLNTKILSK
jgi:hypothetical protein